MAKIAMQETLVQTVKGDISALRAYLERNQVSGIFQYPPHTAWQIKGSSGSITVYTSGKVVIQSNDAMWAHSVSNLIAQFGSSSDSNTSEKHINKMPYSNTSGAHFTPHLGVDEAGKGDFFGPLTVGAVFIESESAAYEIEALGVKDSKKLTDKVIRSIAPRIKEKFAHTVISLSPKDYNKRYTECGNANILLARLHAQAIEEILQMETEVTCVQAVIDQFSNSKDRLLNELLPNGKKITILQMHKGEQDIAVAAASILAREAFITQLDMLSDQFGIVFPKGASDVISTGKQFVKLFGVEKLPLVAKVSFKTAQSVTSSFDI